ncbi:MAG: hypothetical protein JWR86_3555 [Enterovirga sp.]|nr:hypothetical protein [Enterovirga sp.]
MFPVRLDNDEPMRWKLARACATPAATASPPLQEPAHAMTPSLIRRRLVLHVGGFDPVGPEAAHARFVREARRFERAWTVRAEVSGAELSPDLATWTVDASGPNWVVHSELLLLRWDDVMAAQARAPALRRLGLGLLAFADFVAGGALWAYARHAWRYALFFLYPYLLLALLAGVAALIGWAGARATGSGLAGAALGACAFALLLAWAWRRLQLAHLLDDWSFARGYVRAEHPVLSPRLDRVAGALLAAAAEGRADEIVIVGHSLGAVLAVDILDRALAQAPGLGQDGPAVILVTVGSSIPKIGLHRGARRFRAALARVAEAPGLFWVEYQAVTDAMNFYKTNPVRLLLGRDTGGPAVRVVRISRMLQPAYYRRIKRNFFRVHNQFVSGNDLRAAYDYFMVVCGPVPVREQALAPEGAGARIAADGSLVPPSLSGEGAALPRTAR